MIGLLFLCAVVIYSTVLWKQRKIYALHNLLKNESWNLPLFGNCLLFLGGDEVRMNALQRFSRMAMKLGGLTSLWLGPKYLVVVVDPKAAETVLKTCLKKDDVVKIARELFGNGSLFAPLKIWRLRRKVIAPTFSMKNLNQFMEVFSQQSTIMVQQLRNAAGRGTFSVWRYLTTYTMDAVCETTMGINVGAQLHPDQPFLEAFDRHCQMASFRLLQPPSVQKAYTYFPIYKEYVKHINCMWEFVDSIVRKKRQELVQSEGKLRQGNNIKENSPVKTFLELFIESSGGASGFTNIELREETLVLLLAGTDTSAVGTGFTALMLARHPEVQKKVYHEITEVLGDSNETVTSAHLHELKYLDAVVKESIRLYPPVPFIARKVDKDFQLPSGLTIVKGTGMLISIWGIHRNPEYWGEDAEEFRPERFIGAGPSYPAAFMPFSHGPRSCLGYQYAMMSMKTALVNLIRNYRVLPATPVQDKNAPLRVKFDVMMKHVDNFQIQIEPRT